MGTNLDFGFFILDGYWVAPGALSALTLAAEICDCEAEGRLAKYVA